jgi:hypothetical protein
VARTVRQHFGLGVLKADPSKSVFINCPFDAEFAPLFDAILFATVCCGFLPRSALESEIVSDSRMERITAAIFNSKYSIHDLSRCTGEGSEGLARFNMPLELGIAVARRYTQTRRSLKHDWLVLVPEGYRHVKFVSDLAGYDPPRHDGTVETLVPKVMRWLATRIDAVATPTPQDVLAALPRFVAAKDRLKIDWGDDIPWADIVLAARTEAPA